MQFNRGITFLVTAILSSGYTVSRENQEIRRPKTTGVPRYCVQPTDKAGRIKPDKDKEAKSKPHCPNPEVALPVSPSRNRRIEK
jgi:hypothetical protein